MTAEETVADEFNRSHGGAVLMHAYRTRSDVSVAICPPAPSEWVIRVTDLDPRRAHLTAIRAYWHSELCEFSEEMSRLVTRWEGLLSDGSDVAEGTEGDGEMAGEGDHPSPSPAEAELVAMMQYVSGLLDGLGASDEARGKVREQFKVVLAAMGGN